MDPTRHNKSSKNRRRLETAGRGNMVLFLQPKRFKSTLFESRCEFGWWHGVIGAEHGGPNFHHGPFRVFPAISRLFGLSE